YAYDLRLFFGYLSREEPDYLHFTARDFTDEVLSQMKPIVLERYLEYLNYYKADDGREMENTNTGKKRKIATLKSYFKYLYKMERIPANMAEKVALPKIKEKPIIRLEPDEVAKILDEVESGTDLTKRQQQFHKTTKLRDVAIFTLLLGTGIRISELVGLDIEDFDFSTDSFLITRKGGAKVILYFGEEIEKAILDYLEVRRTIVPAEGSEHALFLSMQKKRMSQRAIQLLVKKYANIVTPLKKISPHKFRSTYGTMLNYETGDIYLVADVLGNKDVNTTRKHYAAMSDEKRRMAAGKVKLRD
ncbi:MAG: tyrosine-type recombinase/integrase, partial [Acutalibacteraceae bacterium]